MGERLARMPWQDEESCMQFLPLPSHDRSRCLLWRWNWGAFMRKHVHIRYIAFIYIDDLQLGTLSSSKFDLGFLLTRDDQLCPKTVRL